MSVYSVGSANALFVSGIYTQSYVVKNSGTATVYLGQDSSLSVATRAFSLPPGSTLVWRGESELWAITEAGTESQIELLYDAESSFTPGPDTVSTRILTDSLFSENVAIAAGAAGTTAEIASLDVSNYASVIMRFADAFGGGIALSNEWTLRLSFEDANGNIIASHYPRCSEAGTVRYRTPVKAEILKVYVTHEFALAVGRDVVLSVYGTQAMLTHYYEHNYGLNNRAVGFTSHTATDDDDLRAGQWAMRGIASGLNATYYMSHVSGRAMIGWARNTATNPYIYIRTRVLGGTDGFLYRLEGASPIIAQLVELFLPERPIRLDFGGTVAGANLAAIQFNYLESES